MSWLQTSKTAGPDPIGPHFRPQIPPCSLIILNLAFSFQNMPSLSHFRGFIFYSSSSTKFILLFSKQVKYQRLQIIFRLNLNQSLGAWKMLTMASKLRMDAFHPLFPFLYRLWYCLVLCSCRIHLWELL